MEYYRHVVLWRKTCINSCQRRLLPLPLRLLLSTNAFQRPAFSFFPCIIRKSNITDSECRKTQSTSIACLQHGEISLDHIPIKKTSSGCYWPSGGGFYLPSCPHEYHGGPLPVANIADEASGGPRPLARAISGSRRIRWRNTTRNREDGTLANLEARVSSVMRIQEIITNDREMRDAYRCNRKAPGRYCQS